MQVLLKCLRFETKDHMYLESHENGNLKYQFLTRNIMYKPVKNWRFLLERHVSFYVYLIHYFIASQFRDILSCTKQNME